jgi:hypothetical protein
MGNQGEEMGSNWKQQLSYGTKRLIKPKSIDLTNVKVNMLLDNLLQQYS